MLRSIDKSLTRTRRNAESCSKFHLYEDCSNDEFCECNKRRLRVPIWTEVSNESVARLEQRKEREKSFNLKIAGESRRWRRLCSLDRRTAYREDQRRSNTHGKITSFVFHSAVTLASHTMSLYFFIFFFFFPSFFLLHFFFFFFLETLSLLWSATDSAIPLSLTLCLRGSQNESSESAHKSRNTP